MPNDPRPVGIFDSGVGGLTVFAQVMQELPHENLISFGDTARVPYGSKSRETVTKFSRQILRFLISMDVKAVVIACNTISSNGYETLRGDFDGPMVETVGPGARALAAHDGKSVGLIATEATIQSGAYERAVLRINPRVKLRSYACPLFVPLVEEGLIDHEISKVAAQMYLTPLAAHNVTAVLMGCTHYPLLGAVIQEAIAPAVLIDPARAIADELKTQLASRGLLREDGPEPYRKFYVSDNTAKFKRISRLALGEEREAEKVDIEGLANV